MTANDRAQPRRTSDVARVSGNASANRRWLQRFETHQSPFRFVVASGAIGRGVLHNTPRVTHNQPASNDASNYEVLHLHHPIQLRNRSPRPPDVRLPHGPRWQETTPH